MPTSTARSDSRRRLPALITDAAQRRCEELGTVGERVGDVGKLLCAAATALRAEQSANSATLRKVVLDLTREAKQLLRGTIALENQDTMGETDCELYRLYSHILVIEATLTGNAVDGDRMCTCPEADALELASEFAGVDNSGGLSGQIDRLSGDVLRERRS